MWMNESDIECAAHRIINPPVLVIGATFLKDFCELINSISDGWPYWSYGTKCSNDLQTIIDQGQWPINQRGHYPNVKPAIKKVLTFLKRCKQTKDNVMVIEFVNQWEQTI